MNKHIFRFKRQFLSWHKIQFSSELIYLGENNQDFDMTMYDSVTRIYDYNSPIQSSSSIVKPILWWQSCDIGTIQRYLEHMISISIQLKNCL